MVAEMKADKLLGGYLLYDGKPAKVVGYITDPAILIEVLETGEQITEVIDCPNYKERVKKIPTIKP